MPYAQMTEWRFIDSGPYSSSFNMAVDEAIALTVRKGVFPPTLRIYEWERKSVSLGSFQKTADIDVGFCIANDVPIVRRPTGGRAILHGDELTYSFSSKNEGYFSKGLLDSYRQLSLAFMSALMMLGLDITIKTNRESGRSLTGSALCFHSTSYGEITLGNRKIVGSAQKRWRDGLLQQGSIPYTVDGELTQKIFNFEPLPGAGRIVGLRDTVPYLEPEGLKKAIRLSFEEVFRVKLHSAHLSHEEDLLARELEARKYRSPDWNFQR